MLNFLTSSVHKLKINTGLNLKKDKLKTGQINGENERYLEN
jgi:hypothetical protein